MVALVQDPAAELDRVARQHREFLAVRHFSALDGLRALSVTAVVWHHTGGGAHHGGVLGRGHLGVDLFFAISGFLITTLLLRERRRTGRISLRRFYLRRTLRIFPLYYAVLSLYVALTLLTRRDTPEGQEFLGNLPAFLTYTSNWFVSLGDDTSTTFYFAWSLATEEQFYLLWPPVLALVLQRLRPALTVPLLVLLGAAAASIAARHLMGDDGLPGRMLGSVQLAILAGAAGAVVLDDERGFRRLAPLLRPAAVAPALIAALVAVVVVHPQQELVQAVMALTVMACCVRDSPVLTPLLTLRPLVWVGTVSYGVYLLHMLASNAVRPVLPAGVPYFAVTLVLAVALASAAYLLFERPILRLKDRRFAAG